MDKKARPDMCCLQETRFGSKDTRRLTVKGQKRDLMKIERKSWVAILVLDKIHFKTGYKKRLKKDPSIPLWGIYSNKPETPLRRGVRLPVFPAAKLWGQPG